MSLTILTDLNGQQFRATTEQAEALEALAVARAGGIATVYGYQPTSDYVKDQYPVLNLQILTRFSTTRLYERKMAALSDIRFSDVKPIIEKDAVLSALPEAQLMTIFNERKAKEVASMGQTLAGDRSGAHREAHDRCYARVADGIKVHFITEKDADGLMQPVLTDGLPTVASIMVHYLELNREVRKAGEYKVVKSGAPVLMSNAINKLLNQKSVGLKTLSLKEGNFERLVVARKSYLPEDVAGIPGDILGG